MSIYGDALENLRVSDLRSAVGMTDFGKGLKPSHPILSANGTPTNQQILDTCRQFYSDNQDLVDTTTENANGAAQNGSFTKTMNSLPWTKQALTQPMQSDTSNSIFNSPNGGDGKKICPNPDCQKGIFGPTLCKVNASSLFSTISVGVNVEGIVIVGGIGGLGCAFDIAKREGPRGYGYATAELGLKIAADINIQACIFNQLPSQLNYDIFGLSVGVYYGLGVTFMVFCTDLSNLTVLGYSIGVGIGLGGGAAVFGGHIWNFG
jgi:hypothetical protein